MKFDLTSQLDKELYDFFHTKVHIAGVTQSDDARYLTSRNKGYDFSQWEMLNLIDLYYNSKFESGVMDSEGQRKLFLNVCKFRADVASKQTDLDVKDFVFLPDDGTSEWGPYLLSREFKDWAKENGFSELLNTGVENFPKYGWLVFKEVKGNLEFVPLRTLRNQQDAENLATARYVIIEHPDMHLDEIQAMPNWDTSKLDMDFGETTTVFERYGFAPLSALKTYRGEAVSDGDDDIIVDTLSIVCRKQKDKKSFDSNILFWEEIKKRPFVEESWTKIHGRLMGMGEVENQIENQVGTNMAFNLYRRQLLWSSKKIFQSADEGIAKNLVRDVKDGDVLQISPNGQITQVDMSNRAIADFSNFMTTLDKNSDQKSFTYEVATGASLPSGTPFRLGVQLSNAVNSHFDLKREKLGLMFKRALVKFIIPKFKKSFTNEHIISMFADEEGFEVLKQMTLHLNLNEAIKDAWESGEWPDVEALTQHISAQLEQQRFIHVIIPDSFYDDVKYRVTLTVTGEEIDLPKKIETLTNIYSSLAQQGDQRANRILKRIASLTGENFDILAGPAPQIQGTQPSPIQPSTLNQPASAPQTL